MSMSLLSLSLSFVLCFVTDTKEYQVKGLGKRDRRKHFEDPPPVKLSPNADCLFETS